MARKKANKAPSKSSEFFVMIHHGFMKGTAWKALKVGPRALYVELKARYNSHNNGDITLSIREAANALNCSPLTAQKYFKDLQEHGFIKERTKGHLGIGGKGIATKWELTELGYKGALPTQEYKNWKPEKKKSPYKKLTQGVLKTNTLDGVGVLETDTGVLKTDTGNTQNDPVPVLKTNTYIDDLPCGLAKPNTQDTHGKVDQSTTNQSHSRLAVKLGPDGWNLLMNLSPTTIENLVAKNEAGSLTDTDIAAAQLEASKIERGIVHG